MLRKVLHNKIHMATVTGASPEYMGSITIDAELLEQSGLRVNDAVLVANCRNGNRFETYVFEGERGKGEIVINGAAAHLVETGDKVIIMHFCQIEDGEYASHRPRVLIMNDDNTVREATHYEPGKG